VSDDTPVDISVLIPTLNEGRYIEQAVAAMRRQRFDGAVEFVFADGGSTDRTREILDSLAREDPRIRVFDNPNRSVSSGLNVALREARGRFVARMDAHTEYPNDYLALGVQRLELGGTRWVSGPQVPVGHGPVSRAVAIALSSPLGRGASRKWGKTGAPAGAEYELDAGVFAGVWEHPTLLEYGGWDERWPRNSDSEMAGRFLAHGERLICVPEMGAAYVPRDSLRGLWRQYRDYGRYRFKTAVRHPETLRRSHLLAPGIVLASAAAIWSPRPLRRLARGGVGLYAATLASATVRAVVEGEDPVDALLVAPVLAIMHFGHGVGAVQSAVLDGIPFAALGSVAGLAGTTRPAGEGSSRGSAAQAHAPSLSSS
jgi:glycosyltransferase involved in cell wall biosynthesis